MACYTVSMDEQTIHQVYEGKTTNSNFEQAALELAERGWTVLPDFLAPEIIANLREEAEQFVHEQKFREAGTGRGGNQAVRAGVRSDQILWLNPDEPTPAQAGYWNAMDDLRQILNRTLFLSLVSLEAHYAVYAPGAFYQKHVDRFQSSDERMISTTLYLNPDWNEVDGGQLRLYAEEGNVAEANAANTGQGENVEQKSIHPQAEQHVDVMPLAGTLALFRSDTVPHEVLPATRARFSLTGWFRRRSLRPF